MSTDPVRAQLDGRRRDAFRADGTRRSMLARAGVAAGVMAMLGLPESARGATTTFDDTVAVVPPGGAAALRLTGTGNVAHSTVTGGALNLDNSGSTGAGAVLYSNRGGDALGRLLTVNQANAANPQHAVRIQNSGTAHAVSIFHDPADGSGDPSAEAVDIVSTNEQDTALGVRGRETGKGTVKITHGKPQGPDANASALSIALEGAGTACQGIYIGNDLGNPTTGDLLHIRNGGPGTDRLRLTAAGQLRLPVEGSEGGIAIGDAALYRSAPQTLATGGGLRVAATVTAGSVVTPAAVTNLQAVEVYKSDLTLNGLGGAADGVVGSSLSSFQHQVRLRPIADNGTGRFTNVFGFYAHALAAVDSGWTVNNYSVVRVEAPGGSGPILNLTGIDIRDLKARGAHNYSIRSFGQAVQMRHSGGVNLGSQASADTILHLRGNGSIHGSLTIDEESGDPSPPAAAAQARLYVKNGTLVVQWHDGAQTLYTTLPLAPAGPYPVSSQATTDTNAP